MCRAEHSWYCVILSTLPTIVSTLTHTVAGIDEALLGFHNTDAARSPLMKILENRLGIREQLVELVRDYALQHVSTLEAALDMLLDMMDIVAEGLRAAYANPASVKGCKKPADFKDSARQKNIRFFLCQYAARKLQL